MVKDHVPLTVVDLALLEANLEREHAPSLAAARRLIADLRASRAEVESWKPAATLAAAKLAQCQAEVERLRGYESEDA